MPRLLAFALAFALAVPATAAPMRTRAGGYELQVLVDGRPVRSFAHQGETWLLGQLGERYTLRVLNRSGRPVEAVVSVDGRDVIDGDTASPQKGGYLVPAYGSVDIDGWRISHAQAAAFRFSSVSNSYAAQMGSGREVGVIGVAIFQEKVRPPPPPPVSVVPRPRDRPDYSCCARGDREQPPAKSELGMNTLDGIAGGSAGPSPAPPPAQPSSSAKPPSAPPASRLAQSDDYAGEGKAAEGHGSAGAAAMDSMREEPMRKKARAGLGTEYGETVNSYIHEVAFERAGSQPNAIIGARYNDREGLLALGIDVDGLSEQSLRRSAEPFPVVERSFAQPPPGWNR